MFCSTARTLRNGLFSTPKTRPTGPSKTGYLVKAAKNDIASKARFKDFQLHVEFNEPKLGPEFKGQDRGNSGVYLQGRYELQVLDSFHNDTYANRRLRLRHLPFVAPPLVNAAKPPGEWQTYDITFHMARFENGKKVKDAHVTVYWNGQLVQDNTDIPHPTGGGAKETPEGGPIRLQFHHHSVRFRNIWIVLVEPRPPRDKGTLLAGCRVGRRCAPILANSMDELVVLMG